MEDETWDNRARYASRVSDVFMVIAQAHFNVELDDTTRQRWSELMQLMRELDTKADDLGSTSVILDELKSFAMFAPRYPALTPGNLPEDKSEKLISRVATTLRHTEHLAYADTDWRYLAARRSEAVQVARGFQDIASDYVMEQPAFKDGFMPFFERIAVTLNYFDSARDLPRDAKDGILSIEPAAKIRAELFRRTIAGLYEQRKPIMHHEVVLPYATACLVGFYSHHVRNKATRAERRAAKKLQNSKDFL